MNSTESYPIEVINKKQLLTDSWYVYALQGRGGPGMASSVGWFQFLDHHLVYQFICMP